MEIQPLEFDLIVVGTGLQEALLAAYAFLALLASLLASFCLVDLLAGKMTHTCTRLQQSGVGLHRHTLHSCCLIPGAAA